MCQVMHWPVWWWGWNSLHVAQPRFHSNIAFISNVTCNANAPSVSFQNNLVSSILKLINNNSSSLNKGNHENDGVWILKQ